MQVVIVHKKSGEIQLCIDFHALNAITIHDSFSLLRIEEALQSVKAAVWFSSFDLAQGYLQLVMDETDIHKTAFHAGSSGLYEFTRMPFELSNARVSFCLLMEMGLGDQQYLTLLFYLDDICVFSSSANEMLDRIALVFGHLKEFNLKMKPKKSFFFQPSVLFLGHLLSKDGILPNPEKVSKVKDMADFQRMLRRFIPSWDWLLITGGSFPNLLKWASPLHNLIRPIATARKHARVNLPPLADNLPPFEWTTNHLESFNKLKDALTSTPILSYPDYT